MRPVLVVSVLLVFGLVVLGLYWWTHATVFTSLGDSSGSDPRPVAKGALSTTIIFPKVAGNPETITIKNLDATFSTNTAQADATFSICHMRAGEDPIGAVYDAGSVCHDIVPAEAGSAFRLGVAPDSDYLFGTMTPSRPGSARLESVEIDYQRGASHLYQRGSQSIRADRKITVY